MMSTSLRFSRSTTSLFILLFLLALVSSSPVSALRSPFSRNRHAAPKAGVRAVDRQADHRRMASLELEKRHHLTTTITLDMTTTETVWTTTTIWEDAGFASTLPTPVPTSTLSQTDSISDSSAASSQATSASSTQVESAQSASETATLSDSQSASVSAPAPASTSASASETGSTTRSVTASVRTFTPTISASLSAAATSSVSSAATASVSASVSETASSSQSLSSSSAVTSSLAASSSFESTTPSASVTASSSSSSSTPSISESLSSSATLSQSATASESTTGSSTQATQSSSFLTTSVSSMATTSATSVSMSPTVSASVTQSSSTIVSTAPTASPTSGSSGGLSTRSLPSRMVAAYYPDWVGWSMPPSSLDFSLLDCVDFAFGLPTAEFDITWDDTTYSPQFLQQLVSAGHAAGKLVRVSLGGWTGSQYFSAAVATDQSRQTFANNILNLYNTYGIDGIDIDWEYPGVQGIGYNGVSGQDTENLATFLHLLRKTLPSDAVISATGGLWPFANDGGNPTTDLSSFAAVLDWVLIMNYDVWNSSPTPGPNAPLSNGCGNSLQPLANAYSGVSSWTVAGMPAQQLMLGVPAYGYISMSTANQLTDKKRKRMLHDRGDVVLQNDNGGTTNGQIQFDSLITQGALVNDGSGNFVGAGGFTRNWDSCSSTPWLKSTSSGQIITYDDPASLSMKAQFANQAGLRGTNMWDASGDTPNWDLTRACRSGLGL